MLFLRGARPILTIFSFFMLHHSSDSQALFTTKPGNPTVVVKGENSTQVLLKWEYDLKGEPRLAIHLYVQKSSQVSRVKVLTKAKGKALDVFLVEYKGRVILDEPGNFRILNVDERDEGKYDCLVVEEDGDTLQSKPVELKVLVVPSITKYDSKKTAELNKNLTLSCNATGKPTPQITWEKVGDNSKKNLSRGHLLHLTNFKIEDIGAYRCIADNGLGITANATTQVEVNCRSNECETIGEVVITMKLGWDSAYTNMASEKANRLAAFLSGEIWKVYTENQKNSASPRLRQVSVTNFREGSVVAFVQLVFDKSGNDPFAPLKREVESGKLGTIPVESTITQITTPTPSSSTTTEPTGGGPETGARSSGLSEEAKWGIIGACIAVALIVTIILVVCCCCRKKKSNQQKGSQYETDSSFMSTKRSGLGGASPAYAQASAYRQPNKYNSQEPARDGNLSYSQVSYTNAEPTQKPSHYTSPSAPPNYEDATLSRQQEQSDKEKEAGFELWC